MKKYIIVSMALIIFTPLISHAQSTHQGALPAIISLLLDQADPPNEDPRVPAIATGKLNDTGIVFAGTSLTTNGDDCSGTGDFAEQDCNVGRDATQADDSDGHAGFSFLKVDTQGMALPNDASDWACVKDNVTGLMWEVKTDDDGLRDKDHTYSWFDPDSTTNGGDDGFANLGVCNGSDCDTSSFRDAVNAVSLCSHSDWRVPTVDELLGIANHNALFPAIDTNFFEITTGSFGQSAFWSEFSTKQTDLSPIESLSIVFLRGSILLTPRTTAIRVRLVRGGPAQ